MAERLGTYQLRVWVGALVHEGTPYLKAWLHDKRSWDGTTVKRITEILVLGADEIPPLPADNLSAEDLLFWWTHDVCLPRNVKVDIPDIWRRQMRIESLIGEGEGLIKRLKELYHMLGSSAPAEFLVGACTWCKREHENACDAPPTPWRTLKFLEAQVEDELLRVRAAIRRTEKRPRKARQTNDE